MKTQTLTFTRLDAAALRYLAQEAALFVGFGYLVLAGGSLPGLMYPSILQMSLGIVALIGLVWFLARLRRPGPSLRTPLDLAVSLAVIAYVLGVIFSADPRRSLIVLPQFLLPILTFYLIADLVRSGWPVELVHKTLLLAGGFVVVLGLVQVGLWWADWLRIGGWADPIPPTAMRISAVLRHPNLVAAFLNLILPLALVRAAAPGAKGTRWGWAVFGLLTLAAEFFTSSRGGWLATAGMLALLGLFALRGRVSAVLGWLGNRLRRPAWLAGGLVLLVGGAAAAARVLAWQLRHTTHIPLLSSRGYIWGPAWQAFLADPLTGEGPFTFGTVFLRTGGTPPGMLLGHAHNFYLNTLAETGLPGLLALLVGLAALARLGWALWRVERPDLYRLGSLTALAGLLIHSLFDTPETVPVITIAAAVLAATALIDPAGTPAAAAPRFDARRWLLGAGWVVVLAGVSWSLWARQPYEAGLEAARSEDWPAASSLFDQAAARDPRLALNWFGAGFAHGMQALDGQGQPADPGQIDTAIRAYETGLAIEPDYAVNWANLGRLYWAAGRRGAAVRALENSVRLGTRVPATRLSLAEMLEASGDLDGAQVQYEEALFWAPFWAGADFFQQTEFRRELLTGWQSSHAAALMHAASPWSAGWAALARGDSETARQAFLPGAQTSAEASLGLGILAARSGQAEAALLLEQAIFLTGDELWVPVWANLELARLAETAGQAAEAQDRREAARALIETMSVFGPGQQGNSEYSGNIYYRESIPLELLPGSHLDLLPDWAAAEMGQVGN